MKLRRLVLILFCCWGLALCVVDSVAAQGARIWLDPAALALTPGSEGTLDIRVEDVVELAGAEVHLKFDPALLEVVDADPSTAGTQIAHGDFLSPDFVVQNVANSVAGTVDYSIACIPPGKGGSGGGVLARVTFRALAEGESLVSVSGALLADVEGQSIAVEMESGVVVVGRRGPSLTVWVLIGLVAAAVAAGCVAVFWSTVKARQSL
jgi:hypothetical protein